MSCYRATNNKYLTCPALMADGRNFTDYRSSRQANDSLRSEMNIISSHNYREFLIKNTDKLLQTDRENAESTNACVNYDEDEYKITSLPEQHIQICDKHSCQTNLNQASGLGVRRAFDNSGEPIKSQLPVIKSTCK